MSVYVDDMRARFGRISPAPCSTAVDITFIGKPPGGIFDARHPIAGGSVYGQEVYRYQMEPARAEDN